MPIYQIHQEQTIPASLEEVWDFISSPRNLREITPAYMGFDIITPGLPEKMYPGMVVGYKVRPVAGIPMKWLTEITQVKPLSYFVDEQRSGPYVIWHHEHFIEAVPGGVRMRDIVTYKPPLGFLGAIANALLIRRQLKQIFDFRRSALEHRFGKP